MINALILDLEKTKNLKILLETMVNACFVTCCKTGYKQKGQVGEYHPVFEFPDTRRSIKKQWIDFVNHKHWAPTKKIRVFVQNTSGRST